MFITLEDEVEAGRRRLVARGRPAEFAVEVEAGERWVERARERLELEREAGRCASVPRVWR
jgi:hypothetical protein